MRMDDPRIKATLLLIFLVIVLQLIVGCANYNPVEYDNWTDRRTGDAWNI